ncbi:MAG: enoyl-CoA hydratase [Candidatus Competibacter sp.]|nr:enoyl-CoA hydratase [Candidatus Competibacter sp.]MDG4583887.1 enoyl-CoA hydratase [Candidatus Competibacter sp.]
MSASHYSDDMFVLRQDEAGVATLTLNRPKQYNALSQTMLGALQAALDAVAADETVQVVVVAGNGAAFCAGHDLKEMRAYTDPAFHQALFAQCGQVMLTINRLPQPVIARVHGIATAAGCQLVAACDLAVASDNARFAVSGINVGLFCATPGVALSRNLGRKQALELLLTGEFIDAPTAQRQGLINRVTSPDQLDAEIGRLTDAICGKSPLAIRMGKELFYRQLGLPLEEAYARASEAMACNMNSEDAREGIDAFIAKRKPTWKGR